MVDVFKALCKSRRTHLQCDQLEKFASKEDQKKIFSCETPVDICEQLTRQETTVLRPCSESSKTYFMETYEGLIGLPETLANIFRHHPPSAGALKACSEDLKAKITLLGPLRPKDMSDVSIKRMSCGEIRTFAQTKTDLILSRLEERLLQEATLTGNDKLSIADLKLSPEEEHALLYDLKNAGPLKLAQCFRMSEEIKTVCQTLTQTMVSAATKLGALGVARKLTARAAVGNLSKLKAEPQVAAETAIQKAMPFENQTAAVKWAKASPDTLATETYQLSQAPRIEIGEFSKVEHIPASEAPGVHNLRVEKAILNNKKVFLKVSRIKTNGVSELGMTYKQLENEVAWTKRMTELGWGPPFRGVTVTADGNYAIVTDYIEGQHLNIPTRLVPAKLRGSQTLVQDLQKIKKMIKTEGIDVQGDLQIRVTADQHAVIVDPEFLPARSLQSIEDAERAIDRTITQIQNSR